VTETQNRQKIDSLSLRADFSYFPQFANWMVVCLGESVIHLNITCTDKDMYKMQKLVFIKCKSESESNTDS